MGDMLKGDERADSPSKGLKDIATAYRNYMPMLGQMTRDQAVPFAQSELATQQATAPGLAKLNNDIFQQYAPQYAATEGKMEAERAAGGGAASARTADALNREFDPEYYSTRAASSDKLGQLLSGMDPNKLTGAEEANAERGLRSMNQASGQSSTPGSNTDAIRSALTFGGALDQKRNTVASAINTASQALPNFKSTGDTFSQITGRGQGTQFGQNFAPAPSTSGSQFGQGILQGLQGIQTNAAGINGNRRSVTDYVNSAYSSATLGGSNGGGGTCCFIFMEAYNGVLPWWVRKCRDLYYSEEPQVAVGYKRMAKWLVPLMSKFEFIRSLVNETMIMPLTSYGGWMMKVEGYEDGQKYSGYKKFWFTVWKMLGQSKEGK
jgi:hypothetical protein